MNTIVFGKLVLTTTHERPGLLFCGPATVICTREKWTALGLAFWFKPGTAVVVGWKTLTTP